MDERKKRSWTELEAGENNRVYRNLAKDEAGLSYVLKIPLSNESLSAPKRATKKWNLFNPDLLATSLNGPQIILDMNAPKKANIIPNSVHVYTTKTNKLKAVFKDTEGIKRKDLTHLTEASAIIDLINEDGYQFSSLKQEYQIRRALNVPFKGMVAPFIEGTDDISEEKKAQALIDIYASTGQIMIDYDSPGNLIDEQKTGKIRCVDFDETVSCNSPISRKSFFLKKDAYQTYRHDYIGSKPIQLGEQINLSLLYLEKQLGENPMQPDVLTKYITAEIVDALHEFEKKSISLTINTLEILFRLNHGNPKLSLSAEAIHTLEEQMNGLDSMDNIYHELQTMRLSMSEEKFVEFTKSNEFTNFVACRFKREEQPNLLPTTG